MSGGHFDYKQYAIDMIMVDVAMIISLNDSTEKDDWGEDIGRHYDRAVIKKLMEAKRTLRKASVMVQRIDWLLSGDDGPDSFLRRWDEELAKINQGESE